MKRISKERRDVALTIPKIPIKMIDFVLGSSKAIKSRIKLISTYLQLVTGDFLLVSPCQLPTFNAVSYLSFHIFQILLKAPLSLRARRDSNPRQPDIFLSIKVRYSTWLSYGPIKLDYRQLQDNILIYQLFKNVSSFLGIHRIDVNIQLGAKMSLDFK